VNHNTIAAALHLLEAEGLLVAEGSGRPRRIVLPAEVTGTPGLRVAILPYGQADKSSDYMMQLTHLLEKAGHKAFFAKKTLNELGMRLPRVARLVEETHADAWVICAGSTGVLTWFANQPLPAFAMFGRRRQLRIAGAGPDKPPAFAEIVRRLIELGHRRIVLLAHRERRLPAPGECEHAFLAELTAHGIETNGFHLPDWDDGAEGFHRMLGSLFSLTPPTAIISETMDLYLGTQQFLMHRGIRVPNDVSLVITDAGIEFDWCRPTVACIRWDSGPLVQRILHWVTNVARGKDDRRQTSIKAKFVEGGTIGPVGL
jgi:DNA-binding LacI/PurR family transcriptional regulator